MPLERRCVRFIDNFSGGTRGALSAEHFLQVCVSQLRTADKHCLHDTGQGTEAVSCAVQALIPGPRNRSGCKRLST